MQVGLELGEDPEHVEERLALSNGGFGHSRGSRGRRTLSYTGGVALRARGCPRRTGGAQDVPGRKVN